MRNAENKIIGIISAQTDSTGNERAHVYLGKCLHDLGLSHSEILGYYKGQSEKAFLCILEDEEHITKLENLAFDFGQESVLISEPDRESYLFFPETGKRENIGTLEEVSSVEGLESFSIVTIGGKETIWTCK